MGHSAPGEAEEMSEDEGRHTTEGALLVKSRSVCSEKIPKGSEKRR